MGKSIAIERKTTNACGFAAKIICFQAGTPIERTIRNIGQFFTTNDRNKACATLKGTATLHLFDAIREDNAGQGLIVLESTAGNILHDVTIRRLARQNNRGIGTSVSGDGAVGAVLIGIGEVCRRSRGMQAGAHRAAG